MPFPRGDDSTFPRVQRLSVCRPLSPVRRGRLPRRPQRFGSHSILRIQLQRRRREQSLRSLHLGRLARVAGGSVERTLRAVELGAQGVLGGRLDPGASMLGPQRHVGQRQRGGGHRSRSHPHPPRFSARQVSHHAAEEGAHGDSENDLPRTAPAARSLRSGGHDDGGLASPRNLGREHGAVSTDPARIPLARFGLVLVPR
mmetsp:Transcript_112827/g.319062  ORF Transcript_112827/g.319062 Transcript_112827/m.319062 type:complete len:200 (-) Transcript_112827:1234-1833(-)